MKKTIKCVIWDLDNTIWQGVLLEGDRLNVSNNIIKIIKELDNRGILQSIASKNEFHAAMLKLQEYQIEDYFLYPQINWNSKAESVNNIAELLNIGKDSIAFIDDQEFERAEVSYMIPEVLCVAAADADMILHKPEFIPRFITEDSKKRRQLYKNEIERNIVKENFIGSEEEFLASLEMNFNISDIGVNDLERVEELTVRTNQLNTTGYIYSYEELDELRHSDDHIMLITELSDRFGDYGKVGIALVECQDQVWCIKLLLMSCRVMSRGVGSILLNYIMEIAKKANVKLQADFVKTDRNRVMYITYRFAGFVEILQNDNNLLLEHTLAEIQPPPDYVNLLISCRH